MITQFIHWPSGATAAAQGALSKDLTTGWLLVILGAAMVAAFAALLVYGWPSSTNREKAGNSVVRAWIAVTLIATLVILTAATLGGTNTALQNILIGGIVATSGTAVAFYFATKANEAANAALLKATGVDGAASASGPLVVSNTPAPTFSVPPAPGDPITFTFKVSNSGSQTLTNVHIADSLQAPGLATYKWPGPAGQLKSGEHATASSSYSILGTDISRGSVQSRSTAIGTSPSNVQVVSTPETTTTPIP